MAESSNVTRIESLPNELLQKIIRLAASDGVSAGGKPRINHEFLLDVISNVSQRFKVIASDP